MPIFPIGATITTKRTNKGKGKAAEDDSSDSDDDGNSKKGGFSLSLSLIPCSFFLPVFSIHICHSFPLLVVKRRKKGKTAESSAAEEDDSSSEDDEPVSKKKRGAGGKRYNTKKNKPKKGGGGSWKKGGGGGSSKKDEDWDPLADESVFWKLAKNYAVHVKAYCSACRIYNNDHREQFVKKGRLFELESRCRKCAAAGFKMNTALFSLTEKADEYS